MSNFECPHCGMVNIDCGKDEFKTPREIELEQKLEKIKKLLSIFWEEEDADKSFDALFKIKEIIEEEDK